MGFHRRLVKQLRWHLKTHNRPCHRYKYRRGTARVTHLHALSDPGAVGLAEKGLSLLIKVNKPSLGGLG